MPRKAIDRTGEKYNMLTILGVAPSRKGRAFSLCHCDCGLDKEIQTNSVVFGLTKSCGCKPREHSDLATNLTEQRFGRLIVISRAPKNSEKVSGAAIWNCLCDCGQRVTIRSDALLSGSTQSCGCIKKIPYKDRVRTHKSKRSDTKEYKLFTNAKHRAKKLNLPFTITLADIIIPDVCPVLNIPIFTIAGEYCPNSPTLDRFIPELGYVPGNINVISYKANTIKSNATTQEIELLLNWMKSQEVT